VDRLLILLGLALSLALLGVGAQWLARARLRRARGLPSEELWDLLAAAPDGRPAVVAFSTPSCAACHTAQKPALAVLESRAEGAVRVLEVDAASRPEVASRFGILTVPATAVLDPTGQLRAVNHGFAGADRLAEQLGLRQG
jgi:thioredoxin-like negative regulator of GroEL